MEPKNQILIAVDDMFFAARIRSTAEGLGLPISIVKTSPDLIQKAESLLPSLIIVDLNSERLDPIESIRQLKSRPDLKSLPVIGFLSHVQIDLKNQAEQAGCDSILPRSAFTQRLPEILQQASRTS
ncbi:MAG TPA: response regulator [Blastocatellia bacterium]